MLIVDSYNKSLVLSVFVVSDVTDEDPDPMASEKT